MDEGRAAEREAERERWGERGWYREGATSTRTRKPPGQQITVYSLHPSPPPHPLALCHPFSLSSSSSAYPSPGRPWLAHEVNNHQKSQCLSRAAALCAPTRASDANTTPPGLYYELLELLHRRRIFTCSASAHLRQERDSLFLLYLVHFFPPTQLSFFFLFLFLFPFHVSANLSRFPYVCFLREKGERSIRQRLE